MRVELASSRAIDYACLHFHYAKRRSFSFIGYNIYNDAGEWCGVVCFDRGGIHTATPFGLVCGEVAVLVRVALNGKQEQTSRAVMAAVRQFSRESPLVQLVVSYADGEQGHVGTLYQATNWIFLQAIRSHPRWQHPLTKAFIHGRDVTPTGLVRKPESGKMVRCHKQADLIKVPVADKYKYAYPLCKAASKMLRPQAKPYPKP